MKKERWILVFFFALLLLIWSLYSSLGSACIPSPMSVAKRLIQQRDRLAFHSFATLKTMWSALWLAIFISIPCSWMMMKQSWTRPIIQSFFILATRRRAVIATFCVASPKSRSWQNLWVNREGSMSGSSNLKHLSIFR